MLTVRFPSGQVVQYNRAGFLQYGSYAWELYTDRSKSRWVASIQASAGAIVEAEPPCLVYNPIERDAGDRQDQLLKRILNLFYRATTKHRR